MQGIIEQLAEKFQKFPGIGRRQAKRFVYHLLRENKGNVDTLVRLIESLKKNMRICRESFQYFYSEDPSVTLSPIARDDSRDRSLIMVVEKDTDLESIEKSGSYGGTYFVLGGLVPIIEETLPSYIHLKELKEILTSRAEKESLKEVILALSFNPESEHTSLFLKKELEPLQKQYNFSISTLGRGLSTGTELEYSDDTTLSNALENRK